MLNAIGYEAGGNNIGSYNTAIGTRALRDPQAANYRVAIGYQAGMMDSSSGSSFVNSIGYEAGFQNKGAYLNALGYQAGYQNNGSHLNAVGYKAGFNNIGTQLNAMGYEAGYNNRGAGNIAIGDSALRDQKATGNYVIAIGRNAGMYDSTTGTARVISIGDHAGYNNKGTISNMVGANAGYNNKGYMLNAFGYEAGMNNVGDYNIAFGKNALSDPASDANYITAIGYEAGRYDSTTGNSYVTSIGAYAGSRNSGYMLNALGFEAGYSNKGSFNTAIGTQALKNKKTISNYNTAIGFQALHNDSSSGSAYNNAIGYQTGYYNRGTYNNFIGSEAGKNVTSSHNNALGTNAGMKFAGSYNNALGYLAGENATGERNIFIGASAGNNLTTGNYNIFLGNEAGPAAPSSVNNQLYIANSSGVPTIYGDLSARRVGINTTAPTNNLSVNGTANKTGGGAWAVFSDKRLKKEIVPYAEGMDLLNKVNVVSFQYNETYINLLGYNEDVIAGKKYVGVIAQELNSISPDMVNEVEINGEIYLEVDPSKFTYALINAVKDHDKRIEAIKKEIEELKNQLEEK